MDTRDTLKAEILALVGSHGREGGLPEADRARLEDLVERLCAIRPHVAAERQDVVTGSWQTEFASFGVKHSMGKNQIHDSDLALQSFSRMPKAPVKVLNLIQEIDEGAKAYNNVVTMTPPSGAPEVNLVVDGRYRLDGENGARFHIDFWRVRFLAPADLDADTLRGAFGLPGDQALAVEFAPPKLWSDIVYVDETMRINRGNLGGLYVLTRRGAAALSI